MCVQLIVGIPLEMVHGSLRILAIYVSGVLAGENLVFLHRINFVNWHCNLFLGSMASGVFDSSAMLIGASGGVYCLLASQAANIVLVMKSLCKTDFFVNLI